MKSVPGNNRFQGMFRGGRREILLATPEESVFFHELSHAAHEKVLKARGHHERRAKRKIGNGGRIERRGSLPVVREIR